MLGIIIPNHKFFFVGDNYPQQLSKVGDNYPQQLFKVGDSYPQHPSRYILSLTSDVGDNYPQHRMLQNYLKHVGGNYPQQIDHPQHSIPFFNVGDN